MYSDEEEEDEEEEEEAEEGFAEVDYHINIIHWEFNFYV